MPPKLLKEYTTPLGNGAGVPKEHRPPPVKNSAERLARPFKVPFTDGHRHNTPMRAAKKHMGSYAIVGEDSANESDLENSNKKRRRGALLPRTVLGDVSLKSNTVHKSYRMPLIEDKRLLLSSNDPSPPLGLRKRILLPPRPLHDPTSEFAIVLYDPTVDVIPGDEMQTPPTSADSSMLESPPTIEEAETNNRRKKTHKSLAEILGISNASEAEMLAKYPNVPVVIDPVLAKILRPHQVAGVKFLYRCTAGLMDPRAKGCIMADEMGLGKTLQCLALMWTLLRQSPRGRRTIEKCIIVCPSSLVRNWANEIVKWLGPGVLTPLAVDGKSTKSNELGQVLQQWSVAKGRNIVRPVLIISYETLRRNVDKLAGTEVGLMLADEGHRLKNGDSLTFTALNSLRCDRRVILSGTPIQNDLSEYFSLLNFANPGYLGTRNDFRKNFENDILRGRDADATELERTKGDAKLKELSEMVSKFIIRRTNDILSKYLPVKYEYVIFSNLSPLQKQLYDHFITSPEIKKLLKGVGSQPLKAIGMLKKLCNHPDLLNLPDDIDGCEKFLPDEYIENKKARGGGELQTWHSGKFLVLERFLYLIRTTSDDKIVLISNYTQTLDLIERMCRTRKYGCLRLDGTMNINKRQRLVDKFNDPQGKEFIFLLSSKAGGCGINLIGANRLILMDPDWNPAADQQALARVWRDGQKKDCFIYRFILTGTIEEKIFQRQSMKMSLSSCVVDEKEDVERLFSGDNLRQLFLLQRDTDCDTHDTYKCSRCDPTTKKQLTKAPAMLYGDSTTWNHLDRASLAQNEDALLRIEADFNDISYAFQYISH
ncbi:DNA-dependent ATPase protein rad54 [Scheffersomyces spartinae]|uniref:DNA-dependent ATPase protein rad54 n=1 Tax=Scheffersomyces spartinae TaxID=45513 RepID=A0A9P7VBR1_9ASCO|nr:DNA-dependent ATPase protein rad54 [Scheffersomyces spartinae]KAG7194800.1 DNA-dependent ATPase protein rad54 [Scheffersomyces spartinae]